MTDIKFIGTTQVELVNSLDESNKISPIQVGENFIEFSFNTLSKDSSDFYHFVITGSNVQVSGNIDSVTTDYQFFSLFSGCSQITDASQLELTAPTMKFFCFGNMFKDCTNLINPPSVEATTLADWCYQGMFAGCSKMTLAPQLPATTLAPYCYYAMFYGCKALTSAPYLSASTLVDWCYNSMFFNCQSLTSISADFTDWNTSGDSTKNWVTGIETVGDFYNDNVDIKYSVDGVPQNWKPDYSNTPLTFKGKAATNAVQLTKSGSPDAIELSYSKNNGTWTAYSLCSVIELAENDTVMFSGANDYFSKDFNNYYNFKMTGTIEAKGNIQSLMNFSDSCTSDCYDEMFWGCTSLTTPPSLPATNLASACYTYMFANCPNLSTAPQLPATTLARSCYGGMFQQCTSLTKAPQLPATTLDIGCYASMFYACSNLVIGPSALPATTLADSCYDHMFLDCRSLKSAPGILPATRVKPYSYSSMFDGCTALTTNMKISATVFDDYVSVVLGCCWRMFQGCNNLSSIEVCFTSWPTGRNSMAYPLDLWTSNVASNGTFIKPAALSTIFNTDGGKCAWIPSGWTVINK